MENPLKSAVMEGAAFAKENGCDFILALGGGAVLDLCAVGRIAVYPDRTTEKTEEKEVM